MSQEPDFFFSPSQELQELRTGGLRPGCRAGQSSLVKESPFSSKVLGLYSEGMDLSGF